MPVTLTVRQVRDALYQVERSTSPEGGAATTALLGRWFHEGLSFLASNDGAESPLAALAEADADLEAWKQILVAHTYEKFVGPRLARHCAALQESAEQVHTYWRAMQAACHWLAELCWSLRSSSRTRTDVEAPWQSLIDMLETDAPICCEFSDPGWSDSVQLVGIADAVLRLASTGAWCVVEFKTGKTSPQADLGQACLYHMMLTEIEKSTPDRALNPSTLALISFGSERQERLFAGTELVTAQKRLRELIGRLAGVNLQNRHPESIEFADSMAVTSSLRTAPVAGSDGTADPSHLEMGRQIVNIFKEYGVSISLDDRIAVGPSFIRFPILLGRGTKVAAVENRAAELQVRLQLLAEPFITRDEGRLVIDVQRPVRQTVLFDDIRSQLPARDTALGSAVVPVGVDLAGKLVCADLSRPEHAHLLVAGTTGSGKSEWLRMAIAGMMVANTPETLKLVIIDPKRNAFHSLQNSQFLWQPLVYPDEELADEVLLKLCAEMDGRYRLLAGADTIADVAATSPRPLPRIVCVCDEYRDLISRSSQERKRIEEQICRLGAKARAAGIHLILATQEPSRDTVKGPLDSNMPARVGLRMGRHLESNMLLGEAGAEKLLGHGDLLFKDVHAPRRLQAPLLTESNRHEIFAANGAAART